MADDTIINNYQYLGNGEIDSAGNPLPGDFYARPKNVTYTWTGVANKFPLSRTTVVTYAGFGTYTMVETYTNDGVNVTNKAVGAWVKS